MHLTGFPVTNDSVSHFFWRSLDGHRIINAHSQALLDLLKPPNIISSLHSFGNYIRGLRGNQRSLTEHF